MQRFRWMVGLASIVLAVALGAGFGCDPSVPAPAASSGPAPASLALALEPDAPLDRAPRVVRLHVTSSSAAPDPATFFLVQGTPSHTELRKLSSEAPSTALAKRIVPALRWVDLISGAVVIAPEVPLDVAETYTLAGGDPMLFTTFSVAPEDRVPILERVWPPDHASATLDLGIWCGDAGLPEAGNEAPDGGEDGDGEETSLAPGGPEGAFARGVLDALGDRCLRFEADDAGADAAGGAAYVPPPIVNLGGASIRLDPRAFTLDEAPQDPSPLSCDAGSQLGPGCATVADDRIVVRTPEAPLLWVIEGAGVDLVRVSEPGTPFQIGGLPALTAISLEVGVVDAAGRRGRTTFTASTKAPAPHVVLNEVLANPLGSEPAQEWIELYNAGAVAAELGGYALLDPGGTTALSRATLPPGAYALIVNQDFSPDDGFDPVPAAGTLLVRVPKLGHGGLSNDGEPLVLEDGSGVVVSKFPPTPKPKAGVSVVRIDPLALDEIATSFSTSADHATPGSSNDP